MNITRAMKLVSRLKGEVKELKKRVNNCLSTVEDNDFDENYDDLCKALSERTRKIITLKTRIMEANIKGGMFNVILNLGELKSRMDFLRELNPRTGVQEDRYGLAETKTKYKSQVTIAYRNKLIEECQATINTLTDQLDEFNAKTSIETGGVTVQSL